MPLVRARAGRVIKNRRSPILPDDNSVELSRAFDDVTRMTNSMSHGITVTNTMVMGYFGLIMGRSLFSINRPDSFSFVVGEIVV
jgi:hypothetical protein